MEQRINNIIKAYSPRNTSHSCDCSKSWVRVDVSWDPFYIFQDCSALVECFGNFIGMAFNFAYVSRKEDSELASLPYKITS